MPLLDENQRHDLYTVAQALDANAGRVKRGERPSPSEIMDAEQTLERVVRSLDDEGFPPGLVVASNAVTVAGHMGRSGDAPDAAVFASGARALYALLAS